MHEGQGGTLYTWGGVNESVAFGSSEKHDSNKVGQAGVLCVSGGGRALSTFKLWCVVQRGAVNLVRLSCGIVLPRCAGVLGTR